MPYHSLTHKSSPLTVFQTISRGGSDLIGAIRLDAQAVGIRIFHASINRTILNSITARGDIQRGHAGIEIATYRHFGGCLRRLVVFARVVENAFGPHLVQTSIDIVALLIATHASDHLLLVIVLVQLTLIRYVALNETIAVLQPLAGIQASVRFQHDATIVGFRAIVPKVTIVEGLADQILVIRLHAPDRAHAASAVVILFALVQEAVTLHFLVDAHFVTVVHASVDVLSQMVGFLQADVDVLVVAPTFVDAEGAAVVQARFIFEGQQAAAVQGALELVGLADRIGRRVQVDSMSLFIDTPLLLQLAVMAFVPVTAEDDFGTFRVAARTSHRSTRRVEFELLISRCECGDGQKQNEDVIHFFGGW